MSEASDPAALTTSAASNLVAGPAAPDHVAKHLVITAPGSVGLIAAPLRPLGDGDFLIETLFSGISTGTEITFFAGTNPKVNEAWDDKLQLFVHSTSTEDTADTYPHDSGYMEVGRVIRSNSTLVPEGALISMPYGHYSHFVANEHDNFVVLPDDFDPALGIFVSKMGPICMNGILYAADEVHRTLVTELTGSLPNERVLVFGAGIVGLLVGMMAKWAGAREVLIVDGIQERLDIAENLGLTPIPATDLLPQVIKKRWSTPDRPLDTGADIVFQCTGSDALLSQALSCLREQGTVIDLGFYQQGTANVFLGKEFHHNRLRHICAQIGGTPRHQQPFWTRPQLAKETIKFLHEYGAALKEHAITHQMPFSQAQDAYDRLLHRDHSMLQVVLHPDMPDAPAAKTSDVSQHSTEAAS